MIENTLLHFKTKTAFNTELEAGNISQTSIVFIDDSKEIWTHGEFYDGSKIDLSSFVTKDELSDALATKQDTISDIDTIRTNAELGATAVQPAAISDMETKTNAASTYIKKTDTIAYATESGYAEEAQRAYLDGNARDIAETYATKDELSGALSGDGTVRSIVAMTQTEYDALETKDATTLYIITD